jgi:hypothetical protein
MGLGDNLERGNDRKESLGLARTCKPIQFMALARSVSIEEEKAK